MLALLLELPQLPHSFRHVSISYLLSLVPDPPHLTSEALVLLSICQLLLLVLLALQTEAPELLYVRHVAIILYDMFEDLIEDLVILMCLQVHGRVILCLMQQASVTATPT
jgi:hypothetical protein